MMTELEAIQARHSVRAYQDKTIESETVELLKAKINELNKEGDLNLQFLEEAGDTFNRIMSKFMGLGSAPSVIACIGPDNKELDEKIGYYGQWLVLYAQQLGLNTCWAGTFNRKKIPVTLEEREKLVLVIAIGYGASQGKVRKSKTFDQVVTGISANDTPAWFKKGVECALLAPTAINQQKFEITYADSPEKVTFIDKGGIYSKVDLGIVRCNFEIGAR